MRPNVGVTVSLLQPIPPHTALGRYTVVRAIGRGGMADVYLAQLRGPGGFQKSVALKVLRPDVGQHQESLAREARIASQLKHPHIVDIYELGVADQKTYLAMEYVDGLTLADLLQSDATPPPSVVMEVAVAVASALSRAHSPRSGAPLFHCDVKPANILISRDGEVKLTDFGIAVVGGLDDRVEVTSGTPPFMAPEQFLTLEVDARTDMFAFGIILGILLLRRYPLEMPVRELLAAGPLPPSLLSDRDRLECDRVLEGCGQVVARCLQSDPHLRYPDMEEVLAVLESLREQVGYRPSLKSWLSASGVLQRQEDIEGDGGLDPTVRVKPDSTHGDALAPLFGRRAEIDAALRWITDGARAVTLWGPSGVGKTAVARKLMARVRAQRALLVRYVPVSGAHGALALAHAVAQAMGVQCVQEQSVEALARVVGAALQERPTLLVLDAVDAAASAIVELVPGWLERAPELQVLVTCQHDLGLPSARALELSRLSPKDAVALVRWVLDNDEHTLDRHYQQLSTEELHRWTAEMQGLPSRLLLAAGRLRRLGPDATLHATLNEATVHVSQSDTEHSDMVTGLEHLDVWELQTLANLTVFPDTMMTSAALDVAAATDHPDAPWPVDILDRLVKLRLLLRVPGVKEARLSLNSGVASELRHQLTASAKAHARLSAWYGRFAAQLTEARLVSDEGPELLWLVQQERDTLAFVAQRGQPRDAIACGTLLARVDQLFGSSENVPSRISALLSSTPATLSERWELLNLAGKALLAQSQASAALVAVDEALNGALVEGLRHDHRELRPWQISRESSCTYADFMRQAGRVMRSNALMERTATRLLLADSLTTVTRHAQGSVDLDAARGLLQLAEKALHDTHAPSLRAYISGRKGYIAHMQGDVQGAGQALREAVRLHTENNNLIGAHESLTLLGQFLSYAGEVAVGREQHQRGLELAQKIHRADLATRSILGLAYVALQVNDLDEAVRLQREACDRHRSLGDRYGYFVAMHNYAVALIDSQLFDEAAEAVSEILTPDLEQGHPGLYAATQSVKAWIDVCHGAGQVDEALLTAVGEALKPIPDQYALYLCRRGEMRLVTGDRRAGLSDLARLKHHVAENPVVTRRIIRVMERFEGRVKSRWAGVNRR